MTNKAIEKLEKIVALAVSAESRGEDGEGECMVAALRAGEFARNNGGDTDYLWAAYTSVGGNAPLTWNYIVDGFYG